MVLRQYNNIIGRIYTSDWTK